VPPQLPNIPDEQFPHQPYPAVPPEHQEENRNEGVADTAEGVVEAVVEGTLEVADAAVQVGSCFDALPALDCAIIDCSPGCV
jgi:hypothetical protein